MGELLGGIIIFFYILTCLKYVFKMINKILKVQPIKNELFNIIYKKVMMFIMKYHNIFGILTIVFVLAHFAIQFSSDGLNIPGTIAAGAMAFQILLGIYGAKVKNKWKYWIILHRLMAAIILIAILIHISGD